MNPAVWNEIFHAFPAAIAGGLLIAVVCSLIGTFVVVKRLVFIGAALSQTAACGIAAGLFFHFNPVFGAVAFTLGAVTVMAYSNEETRVPRDSIMAAIFILTSSLGVLFVSKSAFGLEEVQALLYGDLIITSRADLKILAGFLIPLGICIAVFMRPLVYTFLDRDEAKVLGIRVRFWELLFYYVLGIVVSVASKLGGMLLVFCYLVIPPMGGLIASNRLAGAILYSIALAVLATLGGFYFSYAHDMPTNQVIALAACILLGVTTVIKTVYAMIRQNAGRTAPRS